ncbi:MAG TPA: hypothetical protein VFQ77_05880 [Pseudonocardiaceae bacterium]|jgi:hypothetical protein|nr:hypothetical protein [Pseudonocardiaceae bacterium]
MNDELDQHRDGWQEVEDALQQAMDPGVGRGRSAKRERVVLAERRSSRRVVRTLAEVEEQTGVGEVWARQLVRAQLRLAIRLMALTGVVLGSIPLVFLVAPSLGTISIVGLRLPWLLLGFAVYPFFIAVAWSYNRRADRNEQEFTEMVEN